MPVARVAEAVAVGTVGVALVVVDTAEAAGTVPAAVVAAAIAGPDRPDPDT